MESNEYKCDNCGGVFTKAWADEDAKEEYAAIFGRYVSEDDGIVCEDCYNRIMSVVNGATPDILPDTVAYKIRESFSLYGRAATHTYLDENNIVHVDVLSLDQMEELMQKIKRGELIPEGYTISKPD